MRKFIRFAAVSVLVPLLTVGCSDVAVRQEMSFKIKEIELVPGSEINFDPHSLGEYEMSEGKSCFSDGCDRIYKYDGFELESYTEGNAEILRVVRVLGKSADFDMCGISVGDGEGDVTAALGVDFERVGNNRVYLKNGKELRIFFEDGLVASFELIGT